MRRELTAEQVVSRNFSRLVDVIVYIVETQGQNGCLLIDLLGMLANHPTPVLLEAIRHCVLTGQMEQFERMGQIVYRSL